MIREGGPIGPIKEYLPRLKTVFEQYGVALAYLYGSQARGDAGPLSDVDIAILFSREVPEGERFNRILHLHGELASVFGRDDVNVVDLGKGTPLLNNNVRLYGQVLYCADDAVRVEFEVETLHRYVDTQPLRQEQNKYLVEKLQRGLFGKRIPIQRAR